MLTEDGLQLEEVYAEIGRVLKPGGLFASYEWVATKQFDANNPEHVRIIDEINFGNGLPVCQLSGSILHHEHLNCLQAQADHGSRMLASTHLIKSLPFLSPHCVLEQEMRTHKEAEQAGKTAGLELVSSIDIAVASAVASPWYGSPYCATSSCRHSA